MKKIITILISIIIMFPTCVYAGTGDTLRTDPEISDQIPVYRPSLGAPNIPSSYFRLTIGDVVNKISLAPLFSMSLSNPSDADSKLVLKAKYAFSISDIYCIIDPADTGESVVIDVRECDSAGDNCVTVDTTITCDNDGAEDDGVLSNPGIDAGDWILIDIGTVTGTVTDLTVIAY